MAKRTPDWVRDRGGQGRVATAAYVERLLAAREHPEQGVRACLGVLRLAGPAARAAGGRLRARAGGRCRFLALCRAPAQGRPAQPFLDPVPEDGLGHARQHARLRLLQLTIAPPIQQQGRMIHHRSRSCDTLRLAGMAKALEEQLASPTSNACRFDERLACWSIARSARHNAALAQRLRRAGLRQAACLEDVD